METDAWEMIATQDHTGLLCSASLKCIQIKCQFFFALFEYFGFLCVERLLTHLVKEAAPKLSTGSCYELPVLSPLMW